MHLQESALQIWDGDELIKTVLKTSTGDVRKMKETNLSRKSHKVRELVVGL